MDSSFKQNRDEILYHLVNSMLAGLIALLSGMLAANEINTRVFCVALASSTLVALYKFRDYWATEEKDYKRNKKGEFFAFL